MPAGLQCLLDRIEVQRWGQADIDQVDVIAAQHGGVGSFHCRAKSFCACGIQIADHRYLVQRGIRTVGFDMGGTDAGADNRDTKLSAHRRLPSCVAIASAFSASSMTLKQCACGIARSVRSSTSAIRLALYGRPASLQSMYRVSLLSTKNR